MVLVGLKRYSVFMKKFFYLIVLVGIAAVIFFYIRIYSGATGFTTKEKMLYIRTGKNDRKSLMKAIHKDTLLKHPGDFEKVASKMNLWNHLQPGRYRIPSGLSLVAFIQLIQSGKQTPAKLVINKLRLPGNLSKAISWSIEADSATVAKYVENPDSMRSVGLSATNWSANIIPGTYEVMWTWKPGRVMEKLVEEQKNWWSQNNRLEKAAEKQLSALQVHILASIVDEETNQLEDKPLVASVYLNRLEKGMPLQADPTIRFAMKDFLNNRVFYGHLKTPSPYNTYLNRGLPPGPICTASPESMDAVLNAPKTDYLYFVAKPDFSGYSNFNSNFSEHTAAAGIYQDSLTAWLKRKALRQKAAKNAADSPTNTASK